MTQEIQIWCQNCGLVKVSCTCGFVDKRKFDLFESIFKNNVNSDVSMVQNIQNNNPILSIQMPEMEPEVQREPIENLHKCDSMSLYHKACTFALFTGATVLIIFTVLILGIVIAGVLRGIGMI